MTVYFTFLMASHGRFLAKVTKPLWHSTPFYGISQKRHDLPHYLANLRLSWQVMAFFSAKVKKTFRHFTDFFTAPYGIVHGMLRHLCQKISCNGISRQFSLLVTAYHMASHGFYGHLRSPTVTLRLITALYGQSRAL